MSQCINSKTFRKKISILSLKIEKGVEKRERMEKGERDLIFCFNSFLILSNNYRLYFYMKQKTNFF
jgi:hypothetical protein